MGSEDSAVRLDEDLTNWQRRLYFRNQSDRTQAINQIRLTVVCCGDSLQELIFGSSAEEVLYFSGRIGQLNIQ